MTLFAHIILQGVDIGVFCLKKPNLSYMWVGDVGLFEIVKNNRRLNQLLNHATFSIYITSAVYNS